MTNEPFPVFAARRSRRPSALKSPVSRMSGVNDTDAVTDGGPKGDPGSGIPEGVVRSPGSLGKIAGEFPGRSAISQLLPRVRARTRSGMPSPVKSPFAAAIIRIDCESAAVEGTSRNCGTIFGIPGVSGTRNPDWPAPSARPIDGRPKNIVRGSVTNTKNRVVRDFNRVEFIRYLRQFRPISLERCFSLGSDCCSLAARSSIRCVGGHTVGNWRRGGSGTVGGNPGEKEAIARAALPAGRGAVRRSGRNLRPGAPGILCPE